MDGIYKNKKSLHGFNPAGVTAYMIYRNLNNYSISYSAEFCKTKKGGDECGKQENNRIFKRIRD